MLLLVVAESSSHATFHAKSHTRFACLYEGHIEASRALRVGWRMFSVRRCHSVSRLSHFGDSNDAHAVSLLEQAADLVLQSVASKKENVVMGAANRPRKSRPRTLCSQKQLRPSNRCAQ